MCHSLKRWYRKNGRPEPWSSRHVNACALEIWKWSWRAFISSFKMGIWWPKKLNMTRFVLVNSCYNCLGEHELFAMTITLFHCSYYSCSWFNKLKLIYSNCRKGHNQVKVRPSTADVVCHVTEQTNVNKVDLEVRSSIFCYKIFAPATKL